MICSVPDAAQVVAQDSQYRIVAINDLPSNPGIRREWRYCWRKPGQPFHTLVDAAAYGGGLGDIVDVGALVLARAYVAYETDTTRSGGRYGNNPSGLLTVRNLASGQSRSTAITPNKSGCGGGSSGDFLCVVGPSNYYSCTEGPACTPEVPLLVLSGDGVAAWDAEQKCAGAANAPSYAPCAWGIQALDGRTGWSGLVDSVPWVLGQYPPNPFTGLGIARCVAGCASTRRDLVTWNRFGDGHFAAVK